MKSTFTRLALIALLPFAAACHDSDDDATPAFNAFVQQLIDDTSETTDPVSLEGRTFTFDEDPAAFDALFQ